MKLSRLQIALLTFLILCVPNMLTAQNDVNGVPVNNGGPVSPTNGHAASSQTTPGVARSSGLGDSAEAGSTNNGSVDAQVTRDKIFLKRATQGCLAEIHLGELALSRSSTEDVRRFAQKMVADHSTLNNVLKPVAEELGVRLPGELSKADQAEYSKLSILSGSDFNKEYLSYMTHDHASSMREYRMESANTQDPALKAASSKGFTVILGHTNTLEKLDTENGVEGPAKLK